jgi:hypothetical protein
MRGSAWQVAQEHIWAEANITSMLEVETLNPVRKSICPSKG